MHVNSVLFNWDAGEFESLLRSCRTDPVTPYLLQTFPAGGRILESGCGLGRYVAFLEEQGYSVVGVEGNPEAVASVQRVRPGLNVRCGDAAALPFADAEFDGALSLGVVEHFPAGPGRPLRELLRVLKPGAAAVITVPCYNGLRRAKTATRSVRRLLNPLHHARRSPVLRRLAGRRPLGPEDRGYWPRCEGSIPFRRRTRHDLCDFYQYFFGKGEFVRILQDAGFAVEQRVPIGLMDGIHHEISARLVPYEDRELHPGAAAKALNAVFSVVPFLHNHLMLCVVRKPAVGPAFAGGRA